MTFDLRLHCAVLGELEDMLIPAAAVPGSDEMRDEDTTTITNDTQLIVLPDRRRLARSLTTLHPIGSGRLYYF
jgi:hypothetical protein